MARTYDLIELVKQKRSMSAAISKVDPEYAQYAGGSFEISSMIAKIDTFLHNPILPDVMRPLMLLYRDYLQRQRKAFFASVGSDVVTKLGFIQGDPHKYHDATARAP